MSRHNIEYDLLSWEGDILQLDFWNITFDILKSAGAVSFQTTGKQAGCWVMPINDESADETTDSDGLTETFEADSSRNKVIVRSDGTVTYVGKDMAYQFWKFGLLDKDFHFRWFEKQQSGRFVWTTTTEATKSFEDSPPLPQFGHAKSVYNVIDTRQSYLQELLKQALVSINHPSEADHSVHFSYEMVALSRDTARALGYDVDEDAARPFVEVSGRKGLGVKADDLIDRVTEAACAEVSARNTELTPSASNAIAKIIATAAIRYFMIKYSRGKVITFDINEALSFEGESGPYLQYAAVRANNILEKLSAKNGTDEQTIIANLHDLAPSTLDDPDGTDLWALVLESSRLDEIVEQAVRTLELSILAKYAFGLAQAFNTFYHQYPVIKEERRDVRLWRAAAVLYFRKQLTRALDLMGCEVPSRM
jgi:arginyl-tRNA synthetase